MYVSIGLRSGTEVGFIRVRRTRINCTYLKFLGTVDALIHSNGSRLEKIIYIGREVVLESLISPFSWQFQNLNDTDFDIHQRLKSCVVVPY